MGWHEPGTSHSLPSRKEKAFDREMFFRAWQIQPGCGSLTSSGITSLRLFFRRDIENESAKD
jgi:hypothetical protein